MTKAGLRPKPAGFSGFRDCSTPEAATLAPLLLRFATSNAPPSVEAPPGRLQLPALRLARSLSRSAIPRADVDAAWRERDEFARDAFTRGEF